MATLKDLTPLYPLATEDNLQAQDILNMYVLGREFRRRHNHTGGNNGPTLGSGALSWPMVAPDTASLSAPSYSFANGVFPSDLGFYWVTDNIFAAVVSATEIQRWIATGTALTGTLAVSGAVTLTTPLGLVSGGSGVDLSGMATGALVVKNSTAAMKALSQGAANTLLKSNGAGADYSATTVTESSGAFAAITTITMSSTLTMTATASQLIPGATSFAIRNNANNADNILIADAGAITFRAGLSGMTTMGSSGIFTNTATTDATSINTGSIITDGGVGIEKALWVGGLANIAGAVTCQSALTVSGNALTAGAGGTGATSMDMILNGSAAANQGALIRLQRNSISKAFIGTESVVNGGASNDLSLTSVFDQVKIFANNILAATFNTSQNTTLAGTLTVTGVVDYLIGTTALGGGAAPTLGTIGGSGPGTAAQNSWLKIKIGGTDSFIAIWR